MSDKANLFYVFEFTINILYLEWIFMNTWFIHNCVRQNISFMNLNIQQIHLSRFDIYQHVIYSRKQNIIFYEFDLKWIHLSTLDICMYTWFNHDNIRQNISWSEFENTIITLTKIRFMWTRDLFTAVFDKTYLSMSLNIQLMHLSILNIYMNTWPIHDRIRQNISFYEFD